MTADVTCTRCGADDLGCTACGAQGTLAARPDAAQPSRREAVAMALFAWDTEENPHGPTWDGLSDDQRGVWLSGADAVLAAQRPEDVTLTAAERMAIAVAAARLWDEHQSKHGYTDEQVEELGTALYDAGLTEVFDMADEDCDLAARIFLSIAPSSFERILAARSQCPEAQVSRVRALAVEWAEHTDDPRAYAAARILDALDEDEPPAQRPEGVTVTENHVQEGATCSCGDWEPRLGESLYRAFDRHLLAVSGDTEAGGES